MPDTLTSEISEWTAAEIRSPPGENGLPAAEAYWARRLYQVFPYFLDLPEPLRSWYGKIYYGRVDTSQDGVVIKKFSPSMIKQIKSAPNANVTVLNFVADAFKDLRIDLERAGQAGLINTKSFYYKILATRGLEDYNPQYIRATEIVRDRYKRVINGTDARYEKVVDFVSYVDGLVELYKRGTLKVPLTLTGHTVSRFSSQQISGLSIELARENYAVDKVKAEKYIFDPNFRCFVKAARKYGFYVDRNAPWRIIADPFSAPMLEYLSHYGVTQDTPDGITSARIFPYYYNKTYTLDIERLKESLLAMYNKYVTDHPRVVKSYLRETRVGVSPATVRCPHGEQVETITRFPTTREEIDALGNIYWLRLYFAIRTLEGSIKFSDYNKRLKRVIEINNHLGMPDAVKHINSALKPYLYETNLGIKPLTKASESVRIGKVGEHTVVTSNITTARRQGSSGY